MKNSKATPLLIGLLFIAVYFLLVQFFVISYGTMSSSVLNRTIIGLNPLYSFISGSIIGLIAIIFSKGSIYENWCKILLSWSIFTVLAILIIPSQQPGSLLPTFISRESISFISGVLFSAFSIILVLLKRD